MTATPALQLENHLLIADARERLDALTAAIDALPAGAPAHVDASGLVQFDTGALAVLLALRRHCDRNGRTLEVRAVAPRLRGLAELYGIGEVLALG